MYSLLVTFWKSVSSQTVSKDYYHVEKKQEEKDCIKNI